MITSLKRHDVLWINLKVIAQLPPYCRLNTQHELFAIEHITWFSALTRWFRGASRGCCVQRVDDLIDDTEAMLADTDNERTRLQVVQHIQAAKQGLCNLQRTYEADLTTKATIARILDKMETIVTSTNCSEDSYKNVDVPAD